MVDSIVLFAIIGIPRLDASSVAQSPMLLHTPSPELR